MKKYIADIITGARIVMAAAMVFCSPVSKPFRILYILCGLTDMVDGTVARMTGGESDFGGKLDTVADTVFVLAAMVKLLPTMDIPTWLWIWAGVIALIKLINIVSGFVCKKRLVVEHTVMNKITGALLFLLPLSLGMVELKYSGAVVCAAAIFAAVQEGHYIRTGVEV